MVTARPMPTGGVGGGVSMTLQRCREQEEIARKKSMERQRYERFIQAMKRLGYADNHKLPPTWSLKLTNDIVRQEILSDGKGDEEFWTSYEIFMQLFRYRDGRFNGPVQPEFDERMKAAIDELGGGDIFHESLTPESVHQFINLPFVPLHTVWYVLGFKRQKELYRRTGWRFKRYAPPSNLDVRDRKKILIETGVVVSTKSSNDESVDMEEEKEEEEEEEESQFMKEIIMRKEKQQQQQNHYLGTFHKALKQLGGDDNLPNITTEMLHKLITEDLDPVDEDGCWITSKNVEKLLNYYRCGDLCPPWTWEHQNRMIKAVEELGGDIFNEERVNPKTILEFMDDIKDVTNAPRIKKKLEEWRKAYKEDPNHRVLQPMREPRKPDFIVALKSRISLELELKQPDFILGWYQESVEI